MFSGSLDDRWRRRLEARTPGPRIADRELTVDLARRARRAENAADPVTQAPAGDAVALTELRAEARRDRQKRDREDEARDESAEAPHSVGCVRVATDGLALAADHAGVADHNIEAPRDIAEAAEDPRGEFWVTPDDLDGVGHG